MSTLCLHETGRPAAVLPAARFTLSAGATTRFEDRRGLQIICRRGALWITQSGDPRDILLLEGESFVLDRNGRAVVQALRTAEFQTGAA